MNINQADLEVYIGLFLSMTHGLHHMLQDLYLQIYQMVYLFIYKKHTFSIINPLKLNQSLVHSPSPKKQNMFNILMSLLVQKICMAQNPEEV